MASIVLIDDDDNVRSKSAEVPRSDGDALDTAADRKAGRKLQKSRQYDKVIGEK